jgi:hypothetical protein
MGLLLQNQNSKSKQKLIEIMVKPFRNFGKAIIRIEIENRIGRVSVRRTGKERDGASIRDLGFNVFRFRVQ